MKKLFSLLLASVLSIGLIFSTGCANTNAAGKNVKDMTSQEKAEFIKQQAINWLSDSSHQNTVKQGLIIAGNQAMAYAVSGQDRIDIANLMWGSSTLFYSLSTGDIITPETLSSGLKALAPKLSSKVVSDYQAAVNLAWQQVYNNVKIVKDPSLIKTWLTIFAEAAQEVAAPYKTVYLQLTPMASRGVEIEFSSPFAPCGTNVVLAVNRY